MLSGRLKAAPLIEIPSHRFLWLAAAGLAAAAGIAYHNSFAGPFVFDDVAAIPENASIRDLGAWGAVLGSQPDGGVTVGGRPLVNLSFALNYAISGRAVFGYHFTNLLIHWLAALALLGVVRRTLVNAVMVDKYGKSATSAAVAVALCWLVHPLQTSAVTYMVQRAESLMALCYLGTLYAFIRSTEAGARRVNWQMVAVALCAAGMACKEVMVSAPLVVWCYDRTFVAGSFGAAWRARKGFYVALAATWLLLASLVVSTGGRGGTAGFGTDVSSWSYLLTQAGAIIRYVWLAVWPDPLVFDYGTATVAGLGDVWWQVLTALGAIGATGWALWQHPKWGFGGAAFFALLAPSSSVVPIASQTMAEHRMYLPLALLVALVVVPLYRWLGPRAALVVGVIATFYTVLTIDRNRDYQSEITLWTDTVAKRPENARAHNNLGRARLEAGDAAIALVHFEDSIRRDPQAAEPHYNRGVALMRLGRVEEAKTSYAAALRLEPGYAQAHNNLANALLAGGRREEALAHYDEAIRLKPDFAEAHSNRANVLVEIGQIDEARRAAERAIALDPDYPEARYNLGNIQAQAGEFAAARKHYERAVQLKPAYADAHNNLANVLAESEDFVGAIDHYQAALAVSPSMIEARRNLGLVLAHLNRRSEAMVQFKRILEIRPDDAQAQAAVAELQAGGR